MRLRNLVLFAATFSLFTLTSSAVVTDVTYQADGDGAIICPEYAWDGSYTIGVYGDQYGGMGHILFDVQATPEDPTLTLANSIDNDTGFAWTSYQVDVWMNQNFLISSEMVSGPAGWGVDSVAQPVLGTAMWDGNPVPNVYIGHLYLSGTPSVGIGDTLDFSYAISFTGPVSFTEQLVPVPEPASLSLLLGAALLLGGWKATRRQ